MKRDELPRVFLSIIITGIAFGFIEAVCVVYLRELFYPGIHSLFPLKPMSPHIYRTEIYREIATIVFLSGASFAISRRLREVPFIFILLFGIWDITYYLFLKILINWPSGLLEYDILFLIPIPWIAPVYAPVTVSSIFIIGAIFYLYKGLAFSSLQLYLFLVSAFILLLSFIFIPLKILLTSGIHGFSSYAGGGFNPLIFSIGIILLIISFLPSEKLHIY